MAAENIRVATFNTDLSRKGPGLLLRDIQDGKDEQVTAVLGVIDAAGADILALQGFDWDFDLAALNAFNARLSDPFPHLFSTRPNTGMATGLDMDGDGRKGRARDAQGYGRFAGQGGMAVLARFPFDYETVADLSSLLWQDVLGAQLPAYPNGDAFPSAEASDAQRLSTTAHWAITFQTGGGPLTLMTFYASPPVFDGPEDRNGLRNAGEIRFWQDLLNGNFDVTPPAGPFVIAGDFNLDGHDGDGRRNAIKSILNDHRIQDVSPASLGAVEAATVQGKANLTHKGPARLDTADWRDEGGPGNLRVDYVLPSTGLKVTGSGVIWPETAAGEWAETVKSASRHRLVWVDIDF